MRYIDTELSNAPRGEEADEFSADNAGHHSVPPALPLHERGY